MPQLTSVINGFSGNFLISRVGVGVFLLSESRIRRMTEVTRIEEAILSPPSTFESVSELCENQPLDSQIFRLKIA